MLHDMTKSIMQARSDILNTCNSVSNNLQHLKPQGGDDKEMAHIMY